MYAERAETDIAASPAERPMGHVIRAAEQLRVEVDRLTKTIDVLLERLDPMLRPEDSAAMLKDGVPQDVRSRFAGTLDELADLFQQQSGRLGYIADRIDL